MTDKHVFLIHKLLMWGICNGFPLERSAEGYNTTEQILGKTRIRINDDDIEDLILTVETPVFKGKPLSGYQIFSHTFTNGSVLETLFRTLHKVSGGWTDTIPTDEKLVEILQRKSNAE